MGSIAKMLNSRIEKVHGHIEKAIKSRKESLNLVENCCIFNTLNNAQVKEYDCGVYQIFSK